MKRTIALTMLLAMVALLASSAQAAVITPEYLIDNGDAGYSTTGTWTGYTSTNYFNTDNESAAYNDAPTATATWAFTGVTNGTYDVYAIWRAHTNRTPDAVYTITDGLGAVSVNQTLAPAQDVEITDNQPADLWFEKLGTVTITDGTVDVVLSFGSGTQANDVLMSDAVALDLVPEPATMTLLLLGLPLALRRRRK
ncbi:MAG: PEP-CTERM sorting domain-containing protein [Phycisphaerae bacterium]|nr:PEP-CTERM sorting domain-containing protein [Phycisphaerae bacterium]